jgi:gamma-glutamyltranspeptidase / glutathione hydrolase
MNQPIISSNGMIATSEPQAADVGLEILKKGGNAIDAAIAVACCLTVTEPTSNGIGGDNFAIVSMNGQLFGLNSSGYAPHLLSKDKLCQQSIFEIPKYGFVPVTVPGAVKGWVELHKKFGRLDFKEVLAPAIKLAREGFIVQKTVSYYWNIAKSIYEKNLTEPMFSHWFDTFLKDGKAPSPNEIFVLKDHANTLEEIANTYGESFYSGNLANQIDSFSKTYQGFIRKEDLMSYQSLWVDPIHTGYKGFNIWEIPPNGQGIIALEALNIVEHLSIKRKNSIDTYHKQIESMKLAFLDGLHYISDIKDMKIHHASLLDKGYAFHRSRTIKDHALEHQHGNIKNSGTVYLATADHDGNMVSMIQSNYMGFGSGLVVPNTGIALHNRGHNFNLDDSSSNCLAPLKRPYHTIIPGFITKGDFHVGPFGVMGGFMQPQGHLQVLMNMIDFGMNPQEALDAPRWQWILGKKVTVESHFSKRILDGLIKRGHEISIDSNVASFGRGQIILRDEKSKLYIGGTEKRCDGKISSF